MSASARRIARLAALAAVSGGLIGCSTVGSFAGAAAGIATGAATTNAAIGIGVGIGVKTATDAVSRSFGRSLKQAEQDRIAAVAGELDAGETRGWEVRHRLPIGHARGEVRLVRVISTPLAQCKEFLFSVVDDDAEAAGAPWFAASACRQAQQWKWAGAEPAVARWGSLH